MSSRRFSTVHDLVALRLHPDGTRVQNSESNRTRRKAKYAARDARGNWFARDAGGVGTVKQRRTVRSEDDADDVQKGEVFDLTGVNGSEDEVLSSRKGKERAQDEDEPEFDLKDSRARKRRRFHEDWSFLDSAVPTRSPSVKTSFGEGSPPIEDGTIELPKPSSVSGSALYSCHSVATNKNNKQDLLKCVHYFATTYYNAMGQLYDASKDARRQKKLRRLKRLKERAHSVESETATRSQSPETQTEHDEHESLTDEEEEALPNEDEGAQGEQRRNRTRRSRQRRRNTKVDMYKMFDGSALMAIGMSCLRSATSDI